MKKFVCFIICAFIAIGAISEWLDQNQTQSEGSSSSNNSYYSYDDNSNYYDYNDYKYGYKPYLKYPGEKTTCYICDGNGYVTCRICHGSGKNEDYDKLTGTLKAISKKYCEACDGSGRTECGLCHGSGLE